MTPTILTTRTTEAGMLCIAKQDGAYQVACYDAEAGQATVPLPEATFFTYSQALKRLEQEVQGGTAMDTTLSEEEALILIDLARQSGKLFEQVAAEYFLIREQARREAEKQTDIESPAKN